MYGQKGVAVRAPRAAEMVSGVVGHMQHYNAAQRATTALLRVTKCIAVVTYRWLDLDCLVRPSLKTRTNPGAAGRISDADLGQMLGSLE